MEADLTRLLPSSPLSLSSCGGTFFLPFIKVMKKNKRERDEDSVRHGDQYDTQLLWFLMRHMRNRRPQRVSSPCGIREL